MAIVDRMLMGERGGTTSHRQPADMAGPAPDKIRQIPADTATPGSDMVGRMPVRPFPMPDRPFPVQTGGIRGPSRVVSGMLGSTGTGHERDS